MNSKAKCPNCNQHVHQLHYEPIDAATPYGTHGIIKAVTLQCPHCSTILGAALSPSVRSPSALERMHN